MPNCPQCAAELDSGDPAGLCPKWIPPSADKGTIVLGAFANTTGDPAFEGTLAYSRMGRHGEAAAEFQKTPDHPGLVLNDPIGPMARLQLARVSVASGDRAKSAAVYKDLLTLWKDADPDVPVVQQARAEFAKRP
jgi:hypothetical protein